LSPGILPSLPSDGRRSDDVISLRSDGAAAAGPQPLAKPPPSISSPATYAITTAVPEFFTAVSPLDRSNA
jgi:hypothetical protein